jgi:hypothetical protein
MILLDTDHLSEQASTVFASILSQAIRPRWRR